MQLTSRVTHIAFAAAIIGVAAGGCHHHVTVAPLPTWNAGEHCWWAVQRSPLPADSVARRLLGAFRTAGLEAVAQSHVGDTLWVFGNPRTFPSGQLEFRARAVAYQDGDSTHYRVYFANVPSADGIGLCQQIFRAAAIPGVTPREPTGEESLAVWTRRP
jgi:hypothetical protein